MRVCSECQIRKSNREFYSHNRKKCKNCLRLYKKEWRRKNKDLVKAGCRRYWEKNPWARAHRRILIRRNYKSHHYFGRVKNYLKIRDLKFLWFRDRAYLLERPSLDRIDNHGHYTLRNCEYIEFVENMEKSKREKRKQKIENRKQGVMS